MSDRRTEWAQKMKPWGVVLLGILILGLLVFIGHKSGVMPDSFGWLRESWLWESISEEPFEALLAITTLVALNSVWFALIERQEKQDIHLLDAAKVLLKNPRFRFEQQSVERRKWQFRKNPVVVSSKAAATTEKLGFLGMNQWIIDPAEHAFICVARSGVIADPDTVPIGWQPCEDGVEASGRESNFRNEAGLFTVLATSRYLTWTDYERTKSTRLYDGPLAAVHKIPDPDRCFREVRSCAGGESNDGCFMTLRPSGYFAFANTSIAIEVLEAYLSLGYQRGRIRRLVMRSRRRRIERRLRAISVLDFECRSASVGLSVALLVRESTSVDRDTPDTFRLFLHEQGEGNAITSGQIHVVPAGELSLGAAKDRERDDRKIPMSRYVYMSYVKKLAEELYCPSSKLAPEAVASHPLRTGDVGHFRGVPRDRLDYYTEAALEAKVDLDLVGFMFDSLNLKGELLAMSVVTEVQLNAFGSRCGLEFKDPSEEGKVLRSGYDGKLGIRVGAKSGIPKGVFDYPLTPAARVLLDRVDKWLLNGCTSGS